MTFVADKDPLTFLKAPWWEREEIVDSETDDSEDMPPDDVLDNEFQEKVKAAYETLPPKIRALPDFPPIEILDEPMHPAPGREVLGRFLGISRPKKLTFTIPCGPTVIHIYRGPVKRHTSRCGKEIDAVLKTVVWHEVAHWLGFHTEQEVAELGLNLP